MNKFVEFLRGRETQIVGETFENCFLNTNALNGGSKRFVSCTFQGGVGLGIMDSNITFIECVFNPGNERVAIKSNREGAISFDNSTVNGKLEIIGFLRVEIVNITVTEVLKFTELISDNITIANYKSFKGFIGKVLIKDCNPDNRGFLELKDLHVKDVIFSRIVPHKIRFWGGKFELINIDDAQNIGNLQIFGDESAMTNIQIAFLEMKYYNLDGSVLIKDADIGNWNISPFNLNEGKMRLQNVLFKNEVKIIESNLSGVQFNDVNFFNAKLFLDWTYLSDTRFANILWPKGHLVESKMKTDTKEDTVMMLRAKTEVYRQLKKVYKGESNNIEALKFFRNEMSTYWERVKLDKTETRANRFLIRVDRGTSNFGQSYLYPIFWMLGIHLLLCGGIWMFEAIDAGVFCDTSHLDISKGVKEYFTWLVPIYKAPEDWVDISAILGVFMRIFSGFFIYHIIKATRKFGKV